MSWNLAQLTLFDAAFPLVAQKETEWTLWPEVLLLIGKD